MRSFAHAFSRVSFRIKIISLLVFIGLMMLLLLALYSPWQARQVGEANLRDNAGFITGLLSDNLSLGIQTLVFDDGASIQDAIDMVTDDSVTVEKGDALITRVRVFDADGRFLRGFRAINELQPSYPSDSLLVDEGNALLFWRPIKDTDNGEVLGHLEIEFSKQSLIRGVRSGMRTSLLIGFLGFVLVLALGWLILQSIARLIHRLASAAQRVAAGEVDVEVSVDSHDELGQLAHTFRVMVSAQKAKAEAASEIANGNLDAEFHAASDRDVLGGAMVTMTDRLRALQVELARVIAAQKAGDLDARCSTEGFHGAYQEILAGVNDALASVATPLLKVSELLREYADGNLERELETLAGGQRVLSDSLGTIRENLRTLVEEGVNLASAAREGKLEVRGNANRFHGGYREIIEGMNSILDNVTAPLRAVLQILGEMADGNLTARMEGDWKGDYRQILEAVESTQYELNRILGQVSVTVDKVAGGASQVSASSDSLSEHAATQASSLEEISSSITEIGSQTRANAEHTQQTEILVQNTRSAAEEGNRQMLQMVESMRTIEESSGQVTKIIKTIEEIAFQTNLLSLNAAVEAARAGVHGKGFAVVAEEVRNLAQRSGKAAQETAQLIQGSNDQVRSGAAIADSTAASLTKILDGVREVSDLIGEIATASNEQASGVEQVERALQQLDQITQQNASGAEESASAAEELRGLSDQLQKMLTRFRLEASAKSDQTAHDRRKLTGKTASAKGSAPKADKPRGTEIQPNDLLSLNDDDFTGF